MLGKLANLYRNLWLRDALIVAKNKVEENHGVIHMFNLVNNYSMSSCSSLLVVNGHDFKMNVLFQTTLLGNALEKKWL